MKSMMKVSYRCGVVAVVAGIAAMIAAMMFVPTASAAVDAAGVKAVADKEAEYVLSAMERLKGKAILFPEVYCMQGLLRYAAATGDKKIVERVGSLYKAAYLDSGSLNRLNGGWLESQVTAIVPLELYRATGDKAYLKDCWRILEEQRRDAGKDGTYRHARGVTTDIYEICALQAAGYRVFGRAECLDFAAVNANVTVLEQKKKEGQSEAKLSHWDLSGSLKAVGLAQLLEVMPANHAQRDAVEAAYRQAVEKVKLDGAKKEAKGGADAIWPNDKGYSDLFPAADVYAMAVGVRNGWLKDDKYRQQVEGCWKKLVAEYKPKELQSFNILYRPLVYGGSMLLLASAMLEMDRPVAAVTATAAVPSLKTSFTAEELEKALKVWEGLTLENAPAVISFEADNVLSALMELKRYRLSGDYSNEREYLWVLHQLTATPGADKALAALVLAEGYKSYGHTRYAEAAKKYLAEAKGQNVKLESLAAKLLETEKAPERLDRNLGKDAVRLYELGRSIGNDAGKAEQVVSEMKTLCEKLQDETGYFRSREGQKGLCDALSSGQAIVGITALLKALPKDNPQQTYFLRIFRNTAYALERDQDSEGLWHVLPQDFNSPQDLSGSAFFIAALAAGLEQKWIHRLEYREIVDLGYKTLQARKADGEKEKVAVALAEEYSGLYHKSSVPGSKEDIKAVLGPMHEVFAKFGINKYPDGHASRNVSICIKFELAGQKGQDKIDNAIANNLFPEYSMKRAYPAGGISVWLKDNPSIYAITDDLGYCTLAMPYVTFPNENAARDIVVLAGVPGQKSWVYDGTALKGAHLIKTDPENVDLTGLPEGPSDRINGKVLAGELLKYHRIERKELISLIGKEIKITDMGNGQIISPVYLRGKVITGNDKPVKGASVWLRRNPFLMSRSDDNGEFEILMKEAVLYEPDADELVMTAPGYVSLAVPLKSYMDSLLNIQMAPMNYQPNVQINTTLPMLRIPGGYFRMGMGAMNQVMVYDPANCDWETRNGWPIKTVFMPSFYFGQYNNTYIVYDLYRWAISHGYECEEIGGFSFQLFANALSERDGFTPCYYTADLRIIRNQKDVTDRFVCNWRADGYRLPTRAEWDYASYAGRTTEQPWGDDGSGFSRHAAEPPVFGFDPSPYAEVSGYTRGHVLCRRLPVGFGVYDTYLGIKAGKEIIWDINDWRTDDSYSPRGPSMREGRYRNWTILNGKCRVYRFCMASYDVLSTCWYDRWPVGGGFPFNGWSSHLAGKTYLVEGAYFIPPGGNNSCNRLARTAENICNDIRKVKSVDDPITKLPGPVAIELISDKPDMLKISGGSFIMGGAATGSYPGRGYGTEKWRPGTSDINLYDAVGVNSRPEHSVSVSPFNMSKFEITVGQWRLVRTWALSKGYTDLPEGSFGKAESPDLRHPVVGVNWYDAVKWCNAASEKEGRTPCYYDSTGNVYRAEQVAEPVFKQSANGFRLPTEAEWEWAALGGSESSFYWGESIGYPYAWQGKGALTVGSDFKGNSGEKSHLVGQKIGNQVGLYDVYGNVWEWCWDWGAPYIMIINQKQNPQGPLNRQELDSYLIRITEVMKTGKISEDCSVPLSLCTEAQQTAWLVGNRKEGAITRRYIGRIVRGGGFEMTLSQDGLNDGRQRCNARPDEGKDNIGFRVATSGK